MYTLCPKLCWHNLPRPIYVQEVKRHLRCYVKSEMKDHEPHESNRAYYPTNIDIRNHIMQPRLWYCFQSLNLKAMVDEWSESKKVGRYFFCPFIKKESSPSSSEESSAQSSSTATSSSFNKFPVHTRTHLGSWRGVATGVEYGNTMTLVDATYKQPSMTSLCFCHCPHKHGLQNSCLLHCSVRVNWTDTRSTKRLQTTQPRLEASIFLCNYSEAGISSIQQAFSTTNLFMWLPLRDHNNGLNKQQQEQLLALLKASAQVPSAVDTSTLGVDAQYAPGYVFHR